MQQQQPSPFGSLPPPGTVTTEQIQKYLDENKQLILAILDNQNSGKLAECAQYQAQLQKNLMYLAAIADAQPPVPTVRPQVIPHAGVPPGNPQASVPPGGIPYMQQPPNFPPRGPPPMHLTPQQVQALQQQQQQQQQTMPPSFQSHMGMRPISFMNMNMNMNNGVHNNASSVHMESSRVPMSGMPDGQGNRQGGAVSEDNHNKNASANEQGSRDSEPPAQLRRVEEK